MSLNNQVKILLLSVLKPTLKKNNIAFRSAAAQQRGLAGQLGARVPQGGSREHTGTGARPGIKRPFFESPRQVTATRAAFVLGSRKPREGCPLGSAP